MSASAASPMSVDELHRAMTIDQRVAAGNLIDEGYDEAEAYRSVWGHRTAPKTARSAGTVRQLRPASRAPSASAKPGLEDLLTEDSAALRFTAAHRDDLRFCHTAGTWFRWDGAIWRPDSTGAAFHFARELARDLCKAEPERAALVASKAAFAAAVERFARSDPAHARTADDWDRDPMILGTPAGLVDLNTGRLGAPDAAAMVTKATAVAPSTSASCPLWRRFLDDSTGGDAGLIRFLQQWAGYCLTGDTREHALVFVFGDGGNGKSVFLNTVIGIIGDYAATAGMDTFTASRGDKHPTDLAMLRGARLVTASETEEGKAWAESRIKQITGGDPVTARFMRQDFFTYKPQFKLTIIGNHKPKLENVDEAMRRRFNIVPFTLKPANPDRELEAKLETEWPSILRWMLEGCLDWRANGLIRPAGVAVATAEYFSDQDLIGQWLEDECDAEADNPHKWEGSAALFASWKAYAEKAGELAGDAKRFSERMQRHGFTRDRAAGMRVFRGVRLQQAVTRDT